MLRKSHVMLMLFVWKPHLENCKSSYHLSPYEVITVLVTVFLPQAVHFIPVVHLFCLQKFVPLNLPHPSTPLVTTCLFPVSLSLFC